MTAVVGVYLHPKACPVCGGRRQVMACRPGRTVGQVVDCPQCTDRAEFYRLVARERMAPTTGGAA